MFSGWQKASSFVKHLKKWASFFEKLASFLHTVVNEKASWLWKLARFLVKWSPERVNFMRSGYTVIRVTLIQVMAVCMFGVKPLPEPMMTHFQLDSQRYISVIFLSRWKIIISWENVFGKFDLQNIGYLIQAQMCQRTLFWQENKKLIHMIELFSIWNIVSKPYTFGDYYTYE